MLPRRKERYDVLYQMGFVRAEAYELSRITWEEINRTPYIKDFIKQRQHEKIQFKAMGWTREQFDRMINKRYVDNQRIFGKRGYQFIKRRGIATMAWVWGQIKLEAESYKNNKPQYRSPSDKAHKKKLKWNKLAKERYGIV